MREVEEGHLKLHGGMTAEGGRKMVSDVNALKISNFAQMHF